jgi:hypothetical protein
MCGLCNRRRAENDRRYTNPHSQECYFAIRGRSVRSVNGCDAVQVAFLSFFRANSNHRH